MIDTDKNKNFQYQWKEFELKGNYYNLTPSHFEKIQPKIDCEKSEAHFEVTPEGLVDLSLKFKKANSSSIIELTLESWIRYSDSNSNIWQTVTCLADLELLDVNGNNIDNYLLKAEKQDKLVDLEQKLKSLTTLAKNEKITLTSEMDV